jgi:hypothetical protein
MAHFSDDVGDEDLKRAIAMSLDQSNHTIDDDDDEDEDLKRALAMSMEDSDPTIVDSESPNMENGNGKAFSPFVHGSNQRLIGSRVILHRLPFWRVLLALRYPQQPQFPPTMAFLEAWIARQWNWKG